MRKGVFIGTSGYSYQHWQEVFYPAALARQEWLEFYTQHFNSVELNVTFYRLPAKKSFEGWYRKTPENFAFAVKGSRFITHIKRLKECEKPLKIFFENACGLGEKLICILWQLPASLRCDLIRLEKFTQCLRKHYSFCGHSFEFRHPTWFNDETHALLKAANMNICTADSPEFPKHEIFTSSFIYLRFHGGKILYGSEYSEEELTAWAQKAKVWLGDKDMLLAFFNNDAHGLAVKNALQFKKILLGL